MNLFNKDKDKGNSITKDIKESNELTDGNIYTYLVIYKGQYENRLIVLDLNYSLKDAESYAKLLENLEYNDEVTDYYGIINTKLLQINHQSIDLPDNGKAIDTKLVSIFKTKMLAKGYQNPTYAEICDYAEKVLY